MTNRFSRASPEGSRRYAERHGINACEFGNTGLFASRVGVGGYRIHHHSSGHREALTLALQRGVNLIDTSSNYTDGGSETLIGIVLKDLIAAGTVRRDETIVVSKVGYVQGQNLELAGQREKSGAPFPEMVKYQDDCWHCIHPEFLEDQLQRSLQRLQLDALDAYLLHNPEYFLSDAVKRGKPVAEAREEYYRRIKAAFIYLEEQCRNGRIGCYGSSSNTFAHQSNNHEFTSLEQVWAIAQEIGADHHFRVIQFPFNLFEHGAATEKNQFHNSQTLLQTAKQFGLATLANRPLNAMHHHRMIRLASFAGSEPTNLKENFDSTLLRLESAQKEFFETVLSLLQLDDYRHELEDGMQWSKHLHNALTVFHDWEHWDHVKQNMIWPQVNGYLGVLENRARQLDLDSSAAYTEWRARFIAALQEAVSLIESKYAALANTRSQKISDRLTSLVPELADSTTLSQMALRAVLGAEGMHVVLLGMRQRSYVEDAIPVLNSPPVPIDFGTLATARWL
jgi:hypothetical protein